jgi:hypothetical protein
MLKPMKPSAFSLYTSFSGKEEPMNKPSLYKTPFIVAWTMLVIGLLGAFNLAYIPLLVEDYDGMSGGFALMVIGGFIAVIAIIVFAVYGKLNRDFKRMLAGEALLCYVLPNDVYKAFSVKEAEDIKSNNKMVLIMILFFCVLFGVIFGAFMDTLFIPIFLGIAVFFTGIFFVTTAFRTNKVKKSQALVCLGMGGAYAFGQMHSWSMAGCLPVSAGFYDGVPDHLPCPYIRITYLAAAYPVPQQQTVTLPVPAGLTDRALWAAGVLKNTYGI